MPCWICGLLGVWKMYGETSAGGCFLTDSKGKILALDSLPEDVKKLLEEHLNKAL